MRNHVLLALLAFALLSAACSKQTAENVYAKQDVLIEQLANSLAGSQNARLTYKDGVIRATLLEGEGDTLSTTGTVSFYYAAFSLTSASLSSGKLLWTNNKAFAESAGWRLTDTTAYAIETRSLKENTLLEGLQTGLAGVRKGEECYILFSGKHGYGMKLHGTISAKSAMAYAIWVEDISNE